MNWSVVEQFVEGKSPDHLSEDMVALSPGFAAIIDGATDETGGIIDGRSAGRLAAETLVEAIGLLPAKANARLFADTLSEALTVAVNRAVAADRATPPDGVTAPGGVTAPKGSGEGQVERAGSRRWPSASVICVSFARNEVWRIGDCNFMIDAVTDVGTKRVDDAAYGFRSSINAALLAAGTPLEEILRCDPGAEAAKPLLALQQELTNITGRWAYGCINGRTVPDDFIEVYAIDPAAEQIVLTSDGYPEVGATLQHSEERLADLLALDPAAVDQLWSMGKALRPGYRSIDDRAYLRLVRT